MTNTRLWVTDFSESKFYHILSYLHQLESHIIFLTGSLITSWTMTNRWWVTLDICSQGSIITSVITPCHLTRLWVTAYFFWKAVLSHLILCIRGWVAMHFSSKAVSYPVLWPTNSLWVTFNAHLLEKDRLLITSSPMTTGSEWQCTFSERQSHQILSYDHQGVQHCQFFWKSVLSHLFYATGCEQVQHCPSFWTTVSSNLVLWPSEGTAL